MTERAKLRDVDAGDKIKAGARALGKKVRSGQGSGHRVRKRKAEGKDAARLKR